MDKEISERVGGDINIQHFGNTLFVESESGYLDSFEDFVGHSIISKDPEMDATQVSRRAGLDNSTVV